MFYAKIWKIISKLYPFNPFLSGTLSNLSVVLLTTCATEFCPVSGKELCEISVLDHTLSIKPVQSKLDRINLFLVSNRGNISRESWKSSKQKSANARFFFLLICKSRGKYFPYFKLKIH